MINNLGFKNACDGISVKYREYIVIDGKQIDIQGHLFQTAYTDTHFIGTFNVSYIKFTTENNIDFKKKEFDYFKEANGIAIKIGTFIVTDVKNSDTKEEVNVIAFDFGLKFANIYKTDLDYKSNKITLFQVLQECCQKCGVALKNTSIENGDFIVDSNQFSEDTLYGSVVSAVAGMSGNFATITSDNKLELRFKTTTNEIIENYVELDDKRDTQPITSVSLGMRNVEGENVVLKDIELIEKYGEHWLILNDNPFAYTQNKRQQLITAIFNKVKGFGYSAFVSKYCFKPYMELGDLIQFRNKEGNLVNSIILEIDTNYDDITLSAKSVTNTAVNYQQPLAAIEMAKRAEFKVDKANLTIQSLVNQVGDRTNKETTITQDLESIEGKIKNTTSYKDTVTNNNQISTSNETAPTNILKFEFTSNNELFNQIYASDYEFTSDETI